jgi:preprotein translocase subunit SecA
MAGRGVDILLGGNPEYLAKANLRKAGIDPLQATQEQWERAFSETSRITEEEHNKVVGLEGLHVIGTERHEARRIDNQLRGRAGRQGDPGSSRFYMSLEDDLMRIFGSDRISGLMARIGMSEGVPIEHRMITKAIERAQKQVEGQNFTIRKHLLEYDDVMNKQRETIYTQRRDILHGKELKTYFLDLIETLVDWILDSYANKDKPTEEWDREALAKALQAQFALDISQLRIDWEAVTYEELREMIVRGLKWTYEEKEKILSPPRMREFERFILLQVIDTQWKEHLLEMDHLKEGIGLRGYGQRDPLVEYKKESYDMFQAMMDRIEEESMRYMFLIQPVREEAAAVQAPPQPQRRQPLYYQRPQEGQSAQPGRPVKQARSMIPKKRKK